MKCRYRQRKIKNLKLNVSANSGATSTLTYLQTGDATNIAMKVATNAIQITGKLDVDGSVVAAGDDGAAAAAAVLALVDVAAAVLVVGVVVTAVVVGGGGV